MTLSESHTAHIRLTKAGPSRSSTERNQLRNCFTHDNFHTISVRFLPATLFVLFDHSANQYSVARPTSQASAQITFIQDKLLCFPLIKKKSSAVN
jgi:hypothetical protein